MSTIDLSNISISYKKELYLEHKEKLAHAKKKLNEAQKTVMLYQQEVRDYEEFIKILHPEIKGAIPNDNLLQEPSSPKLFEENQGGYNKSWTLSEKALYIIKNPKKYNKETITGSNDVINAIISEEPERAQDINTLKSSVPSTVSRLIGKDVLKLSLKGGNNDTHLIPKEWVNNPISEAKRAILDKLEYSPHSQSKEKSHNSHKTLSVCPSKGDMTWENYMISLLGYLGGNGKSYDIYNLAIKGNPELNPNAIKKMVKKKLSQCYLDGKIDAIKGKTKHEGHEYFLKD